MKRTFILLLLIACARASLAQLSGPLSGILGPGIFHIVDTISVESGDSLTLLPGTTFTFDGGYPFLIYGTLLAEGTETDSITFTTDTVANPDRWRGLRFSDAGSSGSCLAYCLAKCGKQVRSNGGGVFCDHSSPAFSHCTITGNSIIDGSGGGLHCSDSSPSFTNCSVMGNSSFGYGDGDPGYGGGLYCINSSPIFTDCIISGNSSGTGYDGNYRGSGGGLYCNNSSPTFTGCTINGNSTTGNQYYSNGGGVCCEYYSSPVFSNCTISGNSTAIRSEGGGVYCNWWSSPTFMQCTISENSAPEAGGGICCHSSGNFESCTIHGNTSAVAGGVYCAADTSIFTNCVVSDNSAGWGGGGINCERSSSTFTNCTISGNLIQAGNGGGVSCWDSSPAFNSTIIAFAKGIGNGIFFLNSSESRINHCDIFGNIGENIVFADNNTSNGPLNIGMITTTNANSDSCDAYFNIFLDPMFVDTAAGDFHLLAGSPCIDAGDPLVLPDSDHTVVEIGAFHFPQQPLSFSVCPDSLDFGSVPYRRDSTLSFWILNPTEDILRVAGIRTTDSAVFHANPTYAQIFPFDSVEIELTFTPMDDTTHLDSVYVAFMGLDEVETVIVQGTGVYDYRVLQGPMSGTLNIDGSPYYVLDDLIIEPADTLTIAPGVELDFEVHCQFIVHGLLLAIGTLQDSIEFTCNTLFNPAGWGGIRFEGTQDSNRLEYCMIEYGNCTISEDSARYGGGVFCGANSSPSFMNCTLRENWARHGGGVCCYYYSSPTFTNCTISGNSASWDGGGVCCYYSSPPFTNCTIIDNSAGSRGGGVYCYESSPTFTTCTLSGNSAGEEGGGVQCYASSLTLTNCTLSDNSAGGDGGGVFCSYSLPTLTNCALIDNSAINRGGGVYCVTNSSPTCNSTIIAFSVGVGIYFNGSPNSQLAYCDIFGNSEGSFGGEVPAGLGQISTTNANGDSCDMYHNIFLNPMFVDTAEGDFHLVATSPCIDAGDPTLPLDPDSTIADIGAFYYHQLTAEPIAVLMPTAYALHPNWPNPFNSTTMIRYDVPQAGQVSLTIFNLLGQRVATLLDQRQLAGTYAIAWDAANLPSGVYLCRMNAPGFVQTRKLVLVK